MVVEKAATAREFPDRAAAKLRAANRSTEII